MAKIKSAPPLLELDIVSDIVCPWCWLGARYFTQARDQFETATSGQISLTWRPFMLDPNVPKHGVSYRDYMRAKFGSAKDNPSKDSPSKDGPVDRFKAMRAHLEAAAPDAGISFDFDNIPMRPNSLNAHRLMRWASGQGKGDKAADILFRTFFKDLKDVGDLDVLSQVSGELGMDADLTRALLETDTDADSVREEIEFYRRLGVSGVPTFIYNGQFAVQGAQPVETHLKAFEKAASLAR